MLAPLAASLLRYGACALPITLERCLFSKITTTMWSGRCAIAFGFFGADRTFSGAGRTFCGVGRASFGVARSFLGARSALSGVGRTGALVCRGAVGTTVEVLVAGPGAGDTGSATVQAADASSNVPAIAKLVRLGEPCT
jgi:hypothetical protein